MKTKTYTLLALMVFFGSLGNVLLSKGMKQFGNIQDYSLPGLMTVFSKTFSSGTIWLGVISLIVFFIFNLMVLSFADLSFVQPASAIGYALVAVMAYFMLGERISPTRWMGVLFICSGVGLVSRTEARTTGE